MNQISNKQIDNGHAEGDWLLMTFAQAITSSIRAGDIAVRLGGDEFLIIFHDCPVEEAERLLARIDEQLAQVATCEEKPFAAGISYGSVRYDPAYHNSQEELIAEADALMYQRKLARKQRG